MKLYHCCITLVCALACTAQLWAQPINLSLQFGINKPIKIASKHRLVLGAQLSANPEWESLDVLDDNDLWRELELLPGTQEDEDEDDDEDEDEDNSNEPGGLLNDEPRQLRFNPRTALECTYQWRLNKRWRLYAGYTTYLQPDRIRHGLDWGTQWSSDLGSKRWILSQQLESQHVGEAKKSGFVLSHGISTRTRLDYKLSKQHRLQLGGGLNGDWEEKTFILDRLRLEGGLRFAILSNQVIQFRWRAQRRVYRKDEFTHGLSISYEYTLGGRAKEQPDND